VFQRINVVPVDLLLSQKILCAFTRPRPMGRDFYDIIFLLGKTRPDFSYLQEKINVGDSDEIKKRLFEKCRDVDFKRLEKEVAPFLFNPDDAHKISFFPDYIKKMDFKN